MIIFLHFLLHLIFIFVSIQIQALPFSSLTY
jgi:hypothetical protein